MTKSNLILFWMKFSTSLPFMKNLTTCSCKEST
jgi:hypothetical protein